MGFKFCFNNPDKLGIEKELIYLIISFKEEEVYCKFLNVLNIFFNLLTGCGAEDGKVSSPSLHIRSFLELCISYMYYIYLEIFYYILNEAAW